ncbi:phosphatase PAP2 family protein [Jeotgalibacillus sp. S-D1]|uniref:phosphatase PAP2 family protein n=1 Tax=Jeotgalibacillus sp. S-D1 TaxID=2552189 RepID=UPI0014046B61|nr:phosphatase PAP2 family protein [Jeotgalibacillus sp. S-D1]
MKRYFYPLGAVTFFASLLLIAGIQTDSVAKIDHFGDGLIEPLHFVQIFNFIGTQLFLGIISILTVLFLWFRRNNYIGMVLLLIAVAGGNVLNKWMKNWIGRDRPQVEHAPDSFGFPSGHAMISLIAAIVIVFLVSEQVYSNTKKVVLYFVAITLSLLTGLSRLASEVHYFTDVVGGWLLGFTYAILCLLVYEWLLKRRRSLRAKRDF